MSFLQRDQYRKMFNGLQEGIIVIDDGVIDFCNELANKVLSKLAGVKSIKQQ